MLKAKNYGDLMLNDSSSSSLEKDVAPELKLAEEATASFNALVGVALTLHKQFEGLVHAQEALQQLLAAALIIRDNPTDETVLKMTTVGELLFQEHAKHNIADFRN